MKWTKIGYWDYLPVRKCMGFEHKIAKGMKKIGLPLHKSSIQKINRNDKEVKREVRSLTICTAKNTKTISLVTKSLNFILRQELSSDKATRRWNWALQVVQWEKANPSCLDCHSSSSIYQLLNPKPQKEIKRVVVIAQELLDLNWAPMIKAWTMNKLLGSFAHAWRYQFITYKIKNKHDSWIPFPFFFS